MAKELYSASEAAKALGISIDTLRRWDRSGRIETRRDEANRRVVPAAEIERLRGGRDTERLSPRNQFPGVVAEVEVDGVMAKVELICSEPVRLVAVVTREAIEELGLKPGDAATAFVKSTSLMLRR